MLDQTTKRKIDSARQILVGKVPDPKAQVEQITTALVYKFMDDMDKESEELGGEAKFFANGFSQYAWTKLLDNKLSGQERLDLYVQAITNMSKNPHIPQLFRDIFKGAFLPYNDPRTLSLFLKEINEFSYEHSENLGNAFEYLLSILGSQGDAGQFRTPRHIIDFIVEVVDPKKNETILDPACGTAGFLISAYKHILKTNKEKALTPDEKLKLMNNLAGYDISPDMVKLALVNMYLHGFPEPKIHEYDTLSSEKRWDETFDVVLANPPFMTPKGGITPHKRFSIQASRAEVLFVDYIVEHLTINGRAGIIVPEGVIFQSNKAYTQLRKKLVEDGLFAVVSLPAGVFNPYAGVKTSILLFDNEISKKTKNFLFVKIQNDGFDLGAQRREIDKNDLPLALQIIKKFKSTLSDSEFSDDEKQLAHVVAKEKIIESGDYNLSGERYKEVVSFVNQKWPMVELGEVCILVRGITYEKDDEVEENGLKVLRANNINLDNSLNFQDIKQISKNINLSEDKKLRKDDIFICLASGSKAHIGKVAFVENDTDYYFGGFMGVVRVNQGKKVISKYIFQQLRSFKFNEYLRKEISGVNINNLNSKILLKYKIPLPPLEIQNEIVEQIEVKQKAIDHAKAVIESLERERRYFGQALRKLEGVEWVELGKIGKISMCKRIFKDQTTPKGDVPFYKIGTFGQKPDAYISQEIYDEYITKYPHPKKGDILISTSGTIGRTVVYDGEPAYYQDSNIVWIDNDEKLVTNEYLYHVFQSIRWTTAKGGTIERLYNKLIEKTKIPAPTIEVQKQLVAEAEKEEEIITANRRLIEIMERKIQEVLSEI
jgi:type I restriction enzyme M protein